MTVSVARFASALEANLAIGWMRAVLSIWRRAGRRGSSARWFLVGGVGRSAHGFGPGPDIRRIVIVTNATAPRPLAAYIRRRAADHKTYELVPRAWHGEWAGVDPLRGSVASRERPRAGQCVAVITHGAIRRRLLPSFWRQVPRVAEQVVNAAGFVTGFGFGTVPLLGLATFSVWESEDAYRRFAWQPGPHADAVDRVRSRSWFTEEWFGRFTVAGSP